MHLHHDQDMKITDAEYAGDLSLILTFSDGAKRIVDFGPFLRSHPHPQYDRYIDPEFFQTFFIDKGNVVWGDSWDMIFPVEDLYSGNI